MNRRDFTRGLAALGLAPMVPVPTVATTASAAAPVAVAGNFTPYMYAWGVHHARTLGQCSPELLASQLGVKMDVAQAINSRLIHKGIITAPNALGISRATQPLEPPVDASNSTEATQMDRGPQADSNTDLGDLLDENDAEEAQEELAPSEEQVETVVAQEEEAPEEPVQSVEKIEDDIPEETTSRDLER